MNEFEETIAPELKSKLMSLGYHSFTGIQQQAIGEIRNGNDLLLLAPTGSGKTITYVLPIIEKINPSSCLQAIVMVPTRELAIQVRDLFRSLLIGSDIKCSVLFGGTNAKSQMEVLKKNVSILIMTPGKAAELIQKKSIKTESLRTIVLDEADQLLKEEMKHEIKRIVSGIKKDVQMVLCSATYHKKINDFIDQYEKNPITIEDQTSKQESIIEQYYWVENGKKDTVLFDVIEKEQIQHALIFTSTIKGAHHLKEKCFQYGIEAECFHHDMEKEERKRVMKQLTSNHPFLLITTDITARGIDITALPYVIQYDVPKDPATYVHRIGRTGRNHNIGKSIIFFAKEEIDFKHKIEQYTNHKMINKTKKKEINGMKTKSKHKKKHTKNIGKRKKK